MKKYAVLHSCVLERAKIGYRDVFGSSTRINRRNVGGCFARRYKKVITRDPLEFAANNQHMNGGIAVDIWGRSSLEGCYAIGEGGRDPWRYAPRRRCA
jgi:succinate dehydrogenase/fumarate reductase flavoprotein subunit